METVQQNGRFTLFSSKFPSNIYSILFAWNTAKLSVYRGQVENYHLFNNFKYTYNFLNVVFVFQSFIGHIVYLWRNQLIIICGEE